MIRLSLVAWIVARIRKFRAAPQNVFLVGLLLGCILSYVYGFGLVIALMSFGIFVFIGRWRGIFVVGAVVGCARSLFINGDYSNSLEYVDGEAVEFIGRIVEEPKYDSTDAKIVLEVVEVDGSSVESFRLYTKVSNAPIKKYGDSCTGNGIISLPRKSLDFDFPGYLRDKNIFLVADIESIVCEVVFDNRGWRVGLVNLREKIGDRIEHHLPEPYSSLLIGILFGVDRAFTDEFANQLQVSGTTHIIAASGYNVLLIANIVYQGLGYVSVGYKKRLSLSIIGIWIFAVVAGLSGSVIRASIMLSWVYFAKLLGLSVDKGYLILLTLVTSVLWYPGLIFQLGYLLSLFATLGLLFLSDRLSLGVVERKVGFIKEYVFPTFIAMLSTAPLLIVSFGSLSLIGLFSNLLVLPLLETTMVLGFVAICISFLASGFLVQVIFNGVYVQLNVFREIIEYLSQFEFLVLVFEENAALWGGILGVILLLILVLSGYLKDKEDGFSEIKFYIKRKE
jgi:competence protein ComEC